MATTHPANVRSAFAELIRTDANGGAGSTTLTLHSAGDALLLSVNIPDFGANVSGVITSATTDLEGTGTAAAGGGTVATYGRVNDGDGNEVFRGSVGVGSGEVQISAVSIAENDIVRITNDLSWSAPP